MMANGESVTKEKIVGLLCRVGRCVLCQREELLFNDKCSECCKAEEKD